MNTVRRAHADVAASIAILTFLLHLAAGEALAQTVEPTRGDLAAGSRIRVTAPAAGLEEAVGTVTGFSETGLLVSFDDGVTRSVPTAGGRYALEVFAGTGNRALEGTAIGLGVGAGVGFLVGLTAEDDEPCPEPQLALLGLRNAFCEASWESAGEKRTRRVIGMSLAVGALGYFIGKSAQYQRWTTVDPDGLGARVTPTFTGDAGGFAVRIPVS